MHSTTDPCGGWETSGHDIIVVERADLARALIAKALRAAGHRVTAVPDAVSACRAVAAADCAVVLVGDHPDVSPTALARAFGQQLRPVRVLGSPGGWSPREAVVAVARELRRGAPDSAAAA